MKAGSLDIMESPDDGRAARRRLVKNVLIAGLAIAVVALAIRLATMGDSGSGKGSGDEDSARPLPPSHAKDRNTVA